MPRGIGLLSARFVATVREPGKYGDGGGLYLKVADGGSGRWVFRFTHAGRRLEMGLGPSRDVPLARAREKAAEARAMLADGINPLAAREADEAVPTFGVMSDRYIAEMESGWKNAKHRDQWIMTMKRYAGPIRTKAVDTIDTDDVLRCIRPIWKTKPETAARTRARIEMVLDSAKAAGFRSGENPARWKGHLQMLLPARRKLTRGHHAAMPYDDVPDFVARLRLTQGLSALALEWCILSAARTGEALEAHWSEIDLDRRLWQIPAERMKGGRPHEVPLTDRHMEILAKVRPLRRADGFLFPGAKRDRPLSVMAFTMVLRRLGAGDYTVHGFRSSFRDWCGDATHFPRDVAEAALAHAIRDRTEAAYRRSSALEKRRDLMAAWARFLEEPTGGNVIPIGASALRSREA